MSTREDFSIQPYMVEQESEPEEDGEDKVVEKSRTYLQVLSNILLHNSLENVIEMIEN